ncbi:MAG: DUF6350 family protein [Bifidobacteriaceae bacterium]|nr:DUF6350 family protein [Bifidobacteriaceae bacterium]
MAQMSSPPPKTPARPVGTALTKPRPERRAAASAAGAGQVDPALRSVRAVAPAARRERDTTSWIRGLMAGVQAAVLSVVCVMVPAVAAFSATSAATVNNGISWLDAARTAADLWLLGHWGSIDVAAFDATPGTAIATTPVALTVAPLGIAIVSLLCCRFLARVSSANGWWLIGFGTLGYVGVAALVMFTVTTSASRPSAPTGLVGGLLIAVIGLIWGRDAGRRPRRPLDGLVPAAWLARFQARVPLWVREVPRTAGLAAAVTAGGACVLTAVWAAIGWEGFAEVSRSLDAGIVGGMALALLSAAFAPNLVAYAISYLAGPGFAVGADTVFSPTEVVTGPMPSLPLLAILPGGTASAAIWLVAVPVVAGALAGLRLGRRLSATDPWWTMPAAACLASLAAAGGLVLIAAGASGAAGPGRMQEVGVDPRAMFIALALQFAAGGVAMVLLSRAQLAKRLHDVTHRERPIRVTGRDE